MSKMSVNLAGVTLKNPVMTASGTFGSGAESVSYTHLDVYKRQVQRSNEILLMLTK